MKESVVKRYFAAVLASTTLLAVATSVPLSPSACAVGPVSPPAPLRGVTNVSPVRKVRAKAATSQKIHHYAGSVKLKSHKVVKPRAKAKAVVKVKAPQELISHMSERTLAPGVVHKVHRSSMYINLLDVDLKSADVVVKPVLAGESFNRLDEVKVQAEKVSAIAAINGNYFKRDGTPLGTLIVDGEWVTGPIFNRTCFGITNDGRVLMDPVTLHGKVQTSNPDAPNIWINNINQPRRSNAHCIAYTRRWGQSVTMAYDGVLLAVDSTGRITGKAPRTIGIPYGGTVLSDGKDGEISKLNVGDLVQLQWQPGPQDWSKVVHAVSGGPVLIRDGKLHVGLKDERFAKSWTGSHIHARTAIGVTADKHLLLATIEGPHTLWDVAKFLKKLGAVDALNLDGGGSTTMVINGSTVTRNRSTFERRVASSLAVLPRHGSEAGYRSTPANFAPGSNFIEFGAQIPVVSQPTTFEIADPQPPQEAVGITPDLIDDAEEDRLLQAVEPKKERRKGFGWMKHLNPLK